MLDPVFLRGIVEEVLGSSALKEWDSYVDVKGLSWHQEATSTSSPPSLTQTRFIALLAWYRRKQAKLFEEGEKGNRASEKVFSLFLFS